MATSSARTSGRRTRADARQLSEQILETFSAKAKRAGIRALIMNELATELRMSASTLYKLYPSKEALAAACVDRWADELSAAELPKRDGKPRDSFDRFMQWIDAWADANAALSPDFARDLQADYPAVWRRYREVIAARKRRGASLLRPLLKPNVDPGVALALLDQIFTTVLQPEFADKLHISRREALRSAVTIWAGGALSRSGKLRSLRSKLPPQPPPRSAGGPTRRREAPAATNRRREAPAPTNRRREAPAATDRRREVRAINHRD